MVISHLSAFKIFSSSSSLYERLTVSFRTGTKRHVFSPSEPRPSPGIFLIPSHYQLFLQPTPAAAASPFDLGGLGSSLPPQPPAEPEKKTAQSFLGSAAGLVNLDNLVQKPKQPAATNPFGMSTSMAPQGTRLPNITTGYDVCMTPNELSIQLLPIIASLLRTTLQ